MTQVLKQLFSSEKAVMAILILIAGSVLAALGHMSVAEWQEFALWVLGIYTGGKSVQGAAAVLASRKTATPPPPPKE